MTPKTYKAFAGLVTTVSIHKKRLVHKLGTNLNKQGGLNPPATKTEQRGGILRERGAKSNIGIGGVKNRRNEPQKRGFGIENIIFTGKTRRKAQKNSGKTSPNQTLNVPKSKQGGVTWRHRAERG